MDAEEMKRRTRLFAINTARPIEKIQGTQINKAYKGPIIRSSSSVGANYTVSRRAKPKPDFINKLKIVEEEPGESLFFFELLPGFNKEFESEKMISILKGKHY